MNYQAIVTIEPGKRGARPCIRHMRIALADVLGWLATGMTHQALKGLFPGSSQVRLLGLAEADGSGNWP
jgi:uncharacterized protein (DUF433 family)